jgi:hypothetical protein
VFRRGSTIGVRRRQNKRQEYWNDGIMENGETRQK